MSAQKWLSPREIYAPPPMDYEAHNAAVDAVWDSYNRGAPQRVPMILGVNCRYILQDRALNPDRIAFYDYFNDPDAMLQVNLRFAWYMRHFLPSDRHMGMPDSWDTAVSFMNTHDAEWFGGALRYPDG